MPSTRPFSESRARKLQHDTLPGEVHLLLTLNGYLPRGSSEVLHRQKTHSCMTYILYFLQLLFSHHLALAVPPPQSTLQQSLKPCENFKQTHGKGLQTLEASPGVEARQTSGFRKDEGRQVPDRW